MHNRIVKELRFQALSGQNTHSKRIIENQTIINGHLSSKYMQKIRIFNNLICHSILLHLLLLHCYFQADRKKNQTFIYFLWGSQICGAFTVVSLILGHQILKEYMKKIHKRDQKLLPLVMSCIFGIVMPYSFLQNKKLYFNNSFNNEELYNSEFKLNYFLTVCSCARMVSFVTAILIDSKFSSPRAARVCSMNGTFTGLFYSMRSLFKYRPVTFILTIFLSSVVIFSYTFRIAECEFISKDAMSAYMNMMWMTTITMTTVGFGDYTPSTPIGRLVGVICMSWGVLIVSVMVAVLTQTLSLNPRQVQSLVILKRLAKSKEVKNAAGRYIRVALWRVWKCKKLKLTLEQDMKERQSRKNFRNQRLGYKLNRNLGCKMDIYNEMSREFMQAEIDISYLLTNYRGLINYISQQMLFTGDKAADKNQMEGNHGILRKKRCL